MKKQFILFFTLLITTFNYAQNLEDILEKETVENVSEVLGTFKGTRILNGHSVETREKGVLEFLIQHRFGQLNSGSYQLFGLDQSNIRFGLEYAITNDLSIALGRNSFEKVYDAYVKYRLFHQNSDDSMPISLTLFGSAAEKTLKDYDPLNKPGFGERMAFTSQLLIARRFSPNFSLQLTPTLIHFNRVPTTNDPSKIYAIGIGSKIKLSNRISLNTEYFLNTNQFESFDTKNSLALGINIETGGHIFQLIFSNSRAMIEKSFIAETTGDFFNGDIHFGFNISRDFHLNKSKETTKIY